MYWPCACYPVSLSVRSACIVTDSRPRLPSLRPNHGRHGKKHWRWQWNWELWSRRSNFLLFSHSSLLLFMFQMFNRRCLHPLFVQPNHNSSNTFFLSFLNLCPYSYNLDTIISIIWSKLCVCAQQQQDTLYSMHDDSVANTRPWFSLGSTVVAIVPPSQHLIVKPRWSQLKRPQYKLLWNPRHKDYSMRYPRFLCHRYIGRLLLTCRWLHTFEMMEMKHFSPTNVTFDECMPLHIPSWLLLYYGDIRISTLSLCF